MARLGWLCVGVLLAACNLSQTAVEPTAVSTAEASQTCNQLVEAALEAADTACSSLNRNQVCYGNRQVEAEFQQNTSSQFSVPGDLVDLLSVRRLVTFPFDQAADTWGIAILKAQANLPDTLPGQNVTILLFGDAVLDKISPEMNAVVLRTGSDVPTCEEAPPPAALVQSPEGTEVTLNINGASVTLGSTIYLSAAQSKELKLATLEGAAIVSAFDTTQIVRPGAQVVLPLGGTDGLAVIGPPSEPQPFDQALVRRSPLTLLERPVQITAPVTPPATGTVPPTSTTAPTPFNPQPTQANLTTCALRSDWKGTYTIQRGDTLFTIAQRYNVSLDELQQANCIDNPNLIQVGQVLRVPFQLALPTTIPPRSVIGTPTPTTAILRVDKTFLKPDECALISWEVYNVSQVYFEGQPTSNVGREQVCPTTGTTYTLLVIHPDGAQVPYTVRIEVALPPDNRIVQTPDPFGR